MFNKKDSKVIYAAVAMGIIGFAAYGTYNIAEAFTGTNSADITDDGTSTADTSVNTGLDTTYCSIFSCAGCTGCSGSQIQQVAEVIEDSVSIE